VIRRAKDPRESCRNRKKKRENDVGRVKPASRARKWERRKEGHAARWSRGELSGKEKKVGMKEGGMTNQTNF